MQSFIKLTTLPAIIVLAIWAVTSIVSIFHKSSQSPI